MSNFENRLKRQLPIETTDFDIRRARKRIPLLDAVIQCWNLPPDNQSFGLLQRMWIMFEKSGSALPSCAEKITCSVERWGYAVRVCVCVIGLFAVHPPLPRCANVSKANAKTKPISWACGGSYANILLFTDYFFLPLISSALHFFFGSFAWPSAQAGFV